MAVDAGGVKKGADDAARHLGGIEKVANRVGGALAGMFAAREVGQFLSSSVKAFAEAEAAWNRLGSTVDATGTAFTSVRPRIEAAANAMMEASRFGDDEFAAALQTLTVQTGNVEKSLSMMGLAADLASAKQTTLESAAQTLGRALAGNTTQLTRMFPALKDSTNLFGDLQKIVQGMAERDVQGLEGQLVQLNNAWGEFKEAIGEALANASGGTSVVNLLTEAIQGLTKWVSQNQAPLTAFAATLGSIVARLPHVIDNINKIREATGLAWADRKLNDLLGIGAASAPSPSAAGTPTAFAPTLSPKVATDAAKALADAAKVIASNQSMVRLAAQSVLLADEQGRAQGRLRLEFDAVNKSIAARRDLTGDLLAATLKAIQVEKEYLALAVQSERLGGARITGKIQRTNMTSAETARRNSPLFDMGGVRARSTETQAERVKRVAGSAAGGPSFLSQFGDALKTQVGDLAKNFGAVGIAALALKPVFDGFREQVGPSLEKLTGPLNEMGRIIGVVVTPILDALAEPMRLVAELFRALMEPLKLSIHILVAYFGPALHLVGEVLKVVATAFSYVTQAVGWFVKGLGAFIDKLVPDWLSHAGKGLEQMGQGMIDAAKAARDHTAITLEATKATESFASSMSNAPRVLALALLRFQASTAGTAGATGTTPGGASLSAVPERATEPVFQFNGPMHFHDVVDMDGVVAAVEGHVAKQSWRAGTSRLAAALV